MSSHSGGGTTQDATARLDLLDLDDIVQDEDRLLRDTVRRFANEQLRPHIAQWFEDGHLPARDLAIEFGKLGVLGMHLNGYGCAGSTARQYGLACTENDALVCVALEAGHLDAH